MDHPRIPPGVEPGQLQELASQIVQSTIDGIFAVDREGRVTFWNEAMEKIFGFLAQEVLGKRLLEAFPFLRESAEGAAIEQALAGSENRATPRPFPAPSRGRPGFYEAFYSPLRSAKGAVTGCFATVRDITERRRTEEQLEESELRFRTMADGAPVLLWMSGMDALCTFFNQGWLDFTGRTLETEFGNGWAEGVHPEDFQHCMMLYLSAFVERRDFRMEYRLRRADGQYRWILDTGRPRYAPDGAFEGYIGSCIDITDMRESAAALRKLNDELERRVEDRTGELKRINAELETFSYSVSHDLRAPLRAINGYSKILMESAADKLDPPSRHSLERVRAASERMGELIDDLLTLSRVTRGEMRPRESDLSALAEEIAQELQKSAPERKVEFEIARGMRALGDPGLLRVLLQNLIGNAWKFTGKRPHSRIEVGQKSQAGGTAYFIQDNGAGFDMAYAGKLFGAFQRLHSEGDYEGTGIGLATVARIVHRHGGRVWGEGETDKGATFYFTLGG